MCWSNHHRKTKQASSGSQHMVWATEGGRKINLRGCKMMNVKILLFLKRIFAFFLAQAWIMLRLKIFTWDSLKKGKLGLEFKRHRVIRLCFKTSQDTKVKVQRFSRPERLGVLLPGPLPLPCCPPSHSGLGGGTWAALRSAGCTARSWTAAASRVLEGMGWRGENMSNMST